MNVTLKIFYSSNPFTPALHFSDWRSAWQLWFTLTRAMVKGESGPHVVNVEIWDGASKLEPEKGLHQAMPSQQFTGI